MAFTKILIPGRVKSKYNDLYPNVDPERVKKTFKVDDETGTLLRYYGKAGWKTLKRKLFQNKEMVAAQMNLHNVLAQDIAWLLYYDEWPKEPIIAIDGNYKNIRKENLKAESEMVEQLGNFLIRTVPNEPRVWEVKVWHHPYFYRGNRFKSKQKAEKWAADQLRIYNEYAVNTEAMTTDIEEMIETPAIGVYIHKPRNCYMVKVRLNGKFVHYSYEHNIEDAIEAQQRGQSEVQEVWGAVPEDKRSENMRKQVELYRQKKKAEKAEEMQVENE